MLITSFSRHCENLFVGARSGRGRASARRRMAAAIEAVESRVLLAVTSTTRVPVSVIEGTVFNGEVMDFTANDAGPFSATINWGDGTPLTAGTVKPKSSGGFLVDASVVP